MTRPLFAALVCLSMTVPARAGLYYSGEAFAELPSQWRGFLLDQRLLRNLAARPVAGQLNPERTKYELAAATLEKAGAKLTADERADLGALYVRLGQVEKAVEVLRAAQRDHPGHFRIVSNLGTAWQLQGDLQQAAECLQQAVRLAPGKLVKAEEMQLKLIRLRQQEAKGEQGWENLFGVKFVGDTGQYEPGRLSAAERKKLSSESVAIAQQLALWLPADGRLLWQVAELASAYGDVRTAAAILDGCVTEFGLRDPELRAHRQAQREAADALAKSTDAKAAHEVHVGTLEAKSHRPLASRFDATALPSINADGVTPLPWAVLGQTKLAARSFQPTFPKYLTQLDGKRVSLAGFMQPLSEDLEQTSFMFIEYPVGCWYCEMPEMSGIVLVELPAGKTAAQTRTLLKVTGKLTLNQTDPENFLYTLSDAKVSEAD